MKWTNLRLRGRQRTFLKWAYFSISRLNLGDLALRSRDSFLTTPKKCAFFWPIKRNGLGAMYRFWSRCPRDCLTLKFLNNSQTVYHCIVSHCDFLGISLQNLVEGKDCLSCNAMLGTSIVIWYPVPDIFLWNKEQMQKKISKKMLAMTLHHLCM